MWGGPLVRVGRLSPAMLLTAADIILGAFSVIACACSIAASVAERSTPLYVSSVGNPPPVLSIKSCEFTSCGSPSCCFVSGTSVWLRRSLSSFVQKRNIRSDRFLVLDLVNAGSQTIRVSTVFAGRVHSLTSPMPPHRGLSHMVRGNGYSALVSPARISSKQHI